MHCRVRRILTSITAPEAAIGPIRSMWCGRRAIFGVESLEDTMAGTLGQPRSNARLLALFALAAMTLAAVGLYGLVTQIVNTRRREMGVRVALGAAPGQIVGVVVGNAARVIAVGIAIGAGLTVALEPLYRSLIFGVSPVDGASLVYAAGLLAAVSVVAALLPARRAAGIDPMESMRAE